MRDTGHTNKASDRPVNSQSTKNMPPRMALAEYPQPKRYAFVLPPPCDPVTEYVVQVPYSERERRQSDPFDQKAFTVLLQRVHHLAIDWFPCRW